MAQQPHFWDYVAKGIEHTTWKRRPHPIFIAPLFTIATTWKQPKCPYVGEWMKRMWYTYNGILLGREQGRSLPFLTIWVNLEDIALSGIIQTETDKYRTISFIRGLKNKNIEKEIRCVVTRDRVGMGMQLDEGRRWSRGTDSWPQRW